MIFRTCETRRLHFEKEKDAKGSRACYQFQIVYDNGEEVFGVACCANCKNCFIYEKLIEGHWVALRSTDHNVT